MPESRYRDCELTELTHADGEAVDKTIQAAAEENVWLAGRVSNLGLMIPGSLLRTTYVTGAFVNRFGLRFFDSLD